MTGVPRVATIRRGHGTREGYLYDRCRCPECRAANRDWHRHYRRIAAERRWGARPSAWTSSVGTVRRLQALAAMGWSASEVARRLGVTDSAIFLLRATRGGRVLASTADRVAALYRDLADKPPTGNAIVRTKRWAERNGWRPPIAWDDDTIDDPDAQPYAGAPVELDEIAVERYVAGTLKHREFQRYSLELVEAIRILAGRRLTDAQIGDRVGVNKRRIQGLRTEHGIPAGVAA